jgi:hypothetical protein
MLLLSPRRAGSFWSAINEKKAAASIATGRMTPPGLAAIAHMRSKCRPILWPLWLPPLRLRRIFGL